MNIENSSDLPFPEDFAVRVLAAADRVSVRRRRTRWAAGAVAATVVAALAVLAPWRTGPAAPPAPASVSPVVADVNLDGISLASAERDRQTEPLDFMFPDAAPLARFSRSYGGTPQPVIVTGYDNPFAEDPLQEDGS